ncbi:MAG: tetratricopeptide repeat protein, partial [Ignavibacteriaceae bacterium]
DSVNYMKNYEKAIKVLEEGRKNYPADSDILVTLSNSYIGARKIEVAMDAFKAGVEQDPQNKYYHYNYGVLLLGAKDFQAAIDQFQKAVEIDPKYVNAQYNLGVANLKWGDYINQEADSLGMKDPNYKQKSELAKSYFEKSVPYLEKAVQLEGSQADMWETLGKAYTIIGKQAEAKNAFDKADQLRK